jgi:gamma-glutamyltranspeptidase/glutathione hydrolase
MPLDPRVSHWLHEKTQARSKRGMVASRHPLSARAGLEILEKGGNAVDAAVAASFAESVVQPAASTIGGGGLFAYRSSSGETHGINYMWQTPGAAHANMFPIEGKPERGLFGWSGVKDAANEIGGLAVAVPGSVAGLVEASKKFGKLSLAEVLDPAIKLAANGFSVDWYGSLMAGIHLDIIKRFKNTARMLLRNGELPYRPNMIGKADVHRQPDLAKTLAKIAEHGASAFYEGDVATSIVDAVKDAGGIISLEDLHSYKPHLSKPVQVIYRGHKVEGEPNGFTIYGQVLNVLSHFDLSGLRPDSAERLRIFIEVFRRCWADRMKVHQDFDASTGPWAELLSADYAANVIKQIGSKPASLLSVQAEGQSRTVHIAAIDETGEMASLTETVIGNYGSFVSSATGVLLNNGMISFAPVPGHPNSIRPNRRSSSFISPLHITCPDSRSIMTIGSSGGVKIATSVLQIANLIVDHKFGAQEAVSYPRVDFEGDTVIVDPRFPTETIEKLQSYGYKIDVRGEELSTFEYGNPTVLARSKNGEITSGVNPYQATTALGF